MLPVEARSSFFLCAGLGGDGDGEGGAGFGGDGLSPQTPTTCGALVSAS